MSTYAANKEPTCQCKEISNSYLVTRLWDIVGNISPRGVINEFDDGFAPEVTGMDGFQAYVSATTGDERTVFFMNIFDTEEQAAVAQQGAQLFMGTGVLTGLIEPNEFTQDELSFHIKKDDCIADSNKGRILSTRLWRMAPGATITPQDVVDTFEAGYGPLVSTKPGFREYGGAIVLEKEFAFFNVFDTEETATTANAGAAVFAESNSVLKGQIEKVVFTEGPIGFDYTCATGFGDETPNPTGGAQTVAPTEDMPDAGAFVKALSSVVLAAFLCLQSVVIFYC